MLRTGASGRLEHIVAYFISALLLVTGYPRRTPWVIGSALAVYAGVLEVGQIFVPGRHSRRRLCCELPGRLPYRLADHVDSANLTCKHRIIITSIGVTMSHRVINLARFVVSPPGEPTGRDRR